ncbi:MAG: HipA domain-containing protein [Patulibacter sp.]
MTTSDPIYVWTWLPGTERPVVAGRIEPHEQLLTFVYARSYVERDDAIALYEPELPLRRGRIEPPAGLAAPSCLLDAGPDAWGQRVILNRLLGRRWEDTDPAQLDTLTYLIESGSDRVGAIDFQRSPTEYVERGGTPATLEELATSAERVEAGVPLTPALDAALLHGSSIGGARPKAQLDDDGRALIAKLSSTTDTYRVVQAEFVAMRLAGRAGLRVAPVQLTQALGKHVLLVERFDRVPGTALRHHFVSALTLLELRDLDARYASYAELAEIIRHRFTAPRETLRELFARITFNILVGNTDDHARNHGALWDGEQLTLTPAYDLCPQLRLGGEASQGMQIGRDGFRLSSLSGCVTRSAEYGLTPAEAREIVDHQIDVIERSFDEVCDEAQLARADRQTLRERAILLPYALEGYASAPSA